MFRAALIETEQLDSPAYVPGARNTVFPFGSCDIVSRRLSAGVILTDARTPAPANTMTRKRELKKLRADVQMDILSVWSLLAIVAKSTDDACGFFSCSTPQCKPILCCRLEVGPYIQRPIDLVVLVDNGETSRCMAA